MPAKSPVTYKAAKLMTMPPTKTTQKVLVESLAALTDSYVALLVKLDADSGDTGGDSNYAATLTPQPRVTA